MAKIGTRNRLLMKVVINGVGIAGPALAFWLAAQGTKSSLSNLLRSCVAADISSIFGASVTILPKKWA